MTGWAELWVLAGFVMYLGGASITAIAAGWIWVRGDVARPDRVAIVAALGATTIWCVAVAAVGPSAPVAQGTEIVRNLAWIAAVYRLFANDGRHETVRPIRPVIGALAFVESLQVILLMMALRPGIPADVSASVFYLSAMFRMMMAVGVLVLIHNLYAGASKSVRSALQWTTGALAAMWAFDLNYFTITYLAGEVPVELATMRGLVAGGIAVPLAVGAVCAGAQIRLRPSRTVAFQSLSLLLIGFYLFLMVTIAQSMPIIGGDFARLTQVGFIFVASVVALVWLPSRRLRRWVKVTAIKHLFQHRYDYRAEWLRFTRTIGQGDAGHPVSADTLQGRIIRAMADITDSPSGVLFRPDSDGNLKLASRWSWRDLDVPGNPIAEGLSRLFEEKNFILDIDKLRMGVDHHGEAACCPTWLSDAERAWAMVPLLHFDRLVGAILLARPVEPRQLDWEDFDLLRVVGQQLASYLAEQAGQRALMAAARFDEFNRRIAFVMHDIKNLASQMSLLARNAERHAEKPEFRADMLVTLTNSADKLNALLARLNGYGPAGSNNREPVDLGQMLRRITEHYSAMHPVALARNDTSIVLGDAEALDQALVHLVQNAIDASGPRSPVCLALTNDGARAVIEILDSGAGMSAEFVREGLFEPFVSSKNSGFGIGAFEAQEIIRAIGGTIDVESREGVGTRFTIALPTSKTQTSLPPAVPFRKVA